MADLQEEHKLLIIELLATGHSTSEAIEAFAEIYPLQKISAQQVCSYKPGTIAGERMSDEHKRYFLETRTRFLADRSAILITHKNYRVAKLQRLLDNARTGKNPKVVLDTIKLYEEIEGGVFQRAKQDDGGAAEGLKTLRKFLGIAEKKPPTSITNGQRTRARSRKAPMEVGTS